MNSSVGFSIKVAMTLFSLHFHLTMTVLYKSYVDVDRFVVKKKDSHESQQYWYQYLVPGTGTGSRYRYSAFERPSTLYTSKLNTGYGIPNNYGTRYQVLHYGSKHINCNILINCIPVICFLHTN
jgi:hypothetical protein